MEDVVLSQSFTNELNHPEVSIGGGGELCVCTCVRDRDRQTGRDREAGIGSRVGISQRNARAKIHTRVPNCRLLLPFAATKTGEVSSYESDCGKPCMKH